VRFKSHPRYSFNLGWDFQITAPESQLSPRLKKESAIFFSISRTPTQTYDYIQRISEQPITEASPFVKSLCAMERFYHRPAE